MGEDCENGGQRRGTGREKDFREREAGGKLPERSTRSCGSLLRIAPAALSPTVSAMEYGVGTAPIPGPIWQLDRIVLYTCIVLCVYITKCTTIVHSRIKHCVSDRVQGAYSPVKWGAWEWIREHRTTRCSMHHASMPCAKQQPPIVKHSVYSMQCHQTAQSFVQHPKTTESTTPRPRYPIFNPTQTVHQHQCGLLLARRPSFRHGEGKTRGDGLILIIVACESALQRPLQRVHPHELPPLVDANHHPAIDPDFQRAGAFGSARVQIQCSRVSRAPCGLLDRIAYIRKRRV